MPQRKHNENCIVIMDPPSFSGRKIRFSKYSAPNTGMAYVAAKLRSVGYQVSIMDPNAEDITVEGNYVKGAIGSNNGGDFENKIYFDLSYSTTGNTERSQIVFSDGIFSPRIRNGLDMGNHPVIEVIPGQIITRRKQMKVRVEGGFLVPSVIPFNFEGELSLEEITGSTK